ncbi:MAG: hypothetical protein COA78_34250 [Blastopirellula sp.]|nr:MAG: hypothetical protein COA78_34250 [Blastopirellula sp.]
MDLEPVMLIGADEDVIVKVIKWGFILLFFIGPILLKLLGASTNQNAQQQIGGQPPPAPQDDMEDEISAFLRQAEMQQKQAQQQQDRYVQASHEEEEEIVSAHLVDHHDDQQDLDYVHELPSHDQSHSDKVENFLGGQVEPEAKDAYARDDQNALERTDHLSYEKSDSDKESLVSHDSIISMFRNPADIRKVIILNEIMKRPGQS